MAKFKFHWGWAIGTFYSLFVLVMVIIVIKSFSVDRSLVVDNYYDYDIAYQKHSDKLANNRALKKDIEFNYDVNSQELKIKYPEGFTSYSGTIQFYKPDNKKLDFIVEVKPDTSLNQRVALSNVVSGKWWIKMNWNGEETPFYREFSFFN